MLLILATSVVAIAVLVGITATPLPRYLRIISIVLIGILWGGLGWLIDFWISFGEAFTYGINKGRLPIVVLFIVIFTLVFIAVNLFGRSNDPQKKGWQGSTPLRRPSDPEQW
jgi:hypothetical protein